MFKRINLQFLISYLGLLPFLIILLDKFFLKYFDTNILKDFSFFYSLIIFVFIGATNWNLKKHISTNLILLGFIPSLLSVIVIFLHLYSYEVYLIIIFFIILQTILDNFIYKYNFERKIYYKIRIPLTIIIVCSLILIQV